MSCYKSNTLKEVVKNTCRELRKNSTPAEKMLWLYLKNRSLRNRKFYRQFPIYYEGNIIDSFFIADFCCFEEKLIIELDGEIHKYKSELDAERTNILNNLGYKVIRFENEKILIDIHEVLKKIESNFENQEKLLYK